MPDFMMESAWTCASNFYFERTVVGSGGDLYVVRWGRLTEARILETGAQHGWQCTCKGYKYRGTCRHIREVESSGERCGWNAEMEPTAEPYRNGLNNDEPECPQCGGALRVMRVAV